MLRGIKLWFQYPQYKGTTFGIFYLKHSNVKEIQRYKMITAYEINIRELKIAKIFIFNILSSIKYCINVRFFIIIYF